MAWIASKAAELAFRALLPSYIKAGYSANRALRAFISEGIGFMPRQRGLELYRGATHKKMKEDLWRSKSIYDLPQESSLTGSHLKGAGKYRLSFRLSIVDDEGNFIEDRFKTIYTNNFKTPYEIAQDSLAYMRTVGDSDWKVDWENSEVMEFTKNLDRI